MSWNHIPALIAINSWLLTDHLKIFWHKLQQLIVDQQSLLFLVEIIKILSMLSVFKIWNEYFFIRVTDLTHL